MMGETNTGDLKAILQGKVVIVGIGNPMRGDDGFGPAVVKALEGKINAVCLDVGTVPENYVGKIVKLAPDTVILADAVHLGAAPGTWAVLEKSEILKTGFTTHDLSPTLVIQFLESERKMAIYLLGVEPQALDMGADMSAPVVAALQEIVTILKEVRPCMKPI